MMTQAKFVESFLTENAPTALAAWKSAETQKGFNATMPKGKKEKKDPAKPKRGKTGYIFFCSEKRAEVKKVNPEMKVTEVTSELGRLWTLLKAENVAEHKRYEALSTADKLVAATALASWNEAQGIETPAPKAPAAPKAAATTPVEPKMAKTLTGYGLYCQQERDTVKAENPGLKVADVTKLLSAAWKALSKSEQDEYTAAAKAAV